MSKKPIFYLAVLANIVFVSGCAHQAASTPTPQPAATLVNDYPTQARVEYVYECMQKRGGENYDTMYQCVCAVDKLATEMPYDDYTQAVTFTKLFSLPGEKGGEFRDPPQSDKLRKRLKEAESNAEKACFGGKSATKKQ